MTWRGFKDSLLQLALVRHRALINAVLLDDLAVVQHVKLFCCVLAREKHDGLGTAWVVRQELGDIVDLVADDAPAVSLLVVLGHFLLGDGHGYVTLAILSFLSLQPTKQHNA
eukprot:TRINITY_DN4341_c0_g1_i7.p1 TRINITY_DN4341_c0_g1~~TRINITY_DN4341_c0_g1_i7.p1  ORF type:complete len:112 (+),score=10.93 TRINITY_DN4341_c0_g1_i7:202-537(+)